MMSAVAILHEAVVAALTAHPDIAAIATGIYDGPPPRAPYPYISIADGFVLDWSTKGARGREVRLALTVWDNGDMPARLHRLMAAVEDAAETLPRNLTGWQVVSVTFLRSLIARDAAGPWAGIVEHRIRMLER
jgi:Protein of unknown function (DUF3168)